MSLLKRSTRAYQKRLLIIDDSIILKEIYRYYADKKFPFGKVKVYFCSGLDDWAEYENNEYDFAIVDWCFGVNLTGEYFIERINAKKIVVVTGVNELYRGYDDMIEYCNENEIEIFHKPLFANDIEKILNTME